MNAKFSEKLFWVIGAALFSLLLALTIGGVYTITPPNGPVDTAYKINRFTGKVWLVKTYAKPLAQGQLRVIAAREAAVEATRDLSEEEQQAFSTSPNAIPASAARRR
ncbi:MAG: hypothetical protein HW419_3059 [Deltaproteobacteria bacterium]|nr:hypothetical protein [Deltaproteobacteria bacterium]